MDLSTTSPPRSLEVNSTTRELSGNKGVYRKIFTAEVELLKSLEAHGYSGHDRNASKSQVDGILTERQKAWTAGRPNESHIENPVLYRHIKLQQLEKQSQAEYLSAVEDVRGLQSGEIDNGNTSSGVIDRIQFSRKERHEACLEELYQELGVINQELEPRVMEASAMLKEYLDQDALEIESLLQKIKNDQDLIYLTSKDLSGLWQKISQHSTVRLGWIEQLGDTLMDFEKDRSTMISEVFRAYTDLLMRIAHLMPPDVHRLMEDESTKMNKSLLQNRRACTDLMRRLQTADVERERQQYLYWESRVDDWRELKIQEAINRFRAFMSSQEVVNPSKLNSLFDAYTTEQKSLNKRRLDLLEQLRDLKPPNSTKSTVLKWHKSFAALTQHLDDCNAKYRGLIDVQQGRVIQHCENELKRISLALFNEGVASEAEIDEIATDHMYPLCGEKKSRFEYETEKMEKYVEDTTAEQKKQFQGLFTFLQGLANLWDSHELGLAREERNLKEKLDNIRKEHDGQNQIREAKLDIVMDRLRQDSTEEALSVSLKQAFGMLDEIKKSYVEFHDLQIKTTQEYSQLVLQEANQYDDALCRFLAVSRERPKKGSLMTLSKSKDSVSKQDSSPRDKGKDKIATQLESLTLSCATQFWILNDAPGMSFFRDISMTDASVKTNYTFVTENPDEEIELLTYIESFKISTELLIELKKRIRQEFLEHLEAWKIDLTDKAAKVVMAKTEEIDNELDLRLHLHDPRPNRAERDIHNVRAAELILHRERITDHCQGTVNELHGLKSQFASMVDVQKREAEKFKHSVEELEGTFIKAAKSHELLSIQDQVSGKLEKYMGVVRASLRKFRQDLEEMLNNIRASNASCRKSLKTFSNGGNFSPDEVDEYRKKLEKIAHKIDHVEGSLMGDLEGMETKLLENAQDVAGKLEDRFKHHLFDLTFLEKISRWLTNVQLKIKSEVAESNSQAQKIAKLIATFDRRIDAVAHPNLDKEQISAKRLHETLVPIIETFYKRMEYLKCGINDEVVTNLQSLKLDLIKSDTDLGDTKKGNSAKKSKKGKAKGEESSSGRSSRTKGARSKTPAETNETSADNRALSPEKQQAASADVEGVPPSESRKSANRTKQGGRYDRKFMVFGEDDVVDDNFHGHIRSILRDSLDGLLTTAEFYYRQKGSRQPTRAQTIHDHFDPCAEAFIHRLRSYKEQAEEYHNSCIQEFRAQVKKFGTTLEKFPSLVIQEFYDEFVKAVISKRKSLQDALLKHFGDLERKKKEYYTLLRPTLGHPKNRIDREKLCQQEQTRREEMKTLIQHMKSQHREFESNLGMEFVRRLSVIVAMLINQFDAVITTDDVVIGTVKPKKKTQKQLLRETLTGSKETKSEDVPMSAGSGLWPGLPQDAFMEVRNSDSTDQTVEIRSKKNLRAHEAIILARNVAFEDYKTQFNAAIERVEKETDKVTNDELRWKENWDRSLQKILDLY